MSCSCQNTLSEKLLKAFQASERHASDHRVELTGFGFFSSGSCGAGFMPVDQTAIYLQAGGKKDIRTQRIGLAFTFCPFCGVAYNNDKAA